MDDPISCVYLTSYVTIFSDLNECLTLNGGCEHICTNTDDSFYCFCDSGYELDSDGFNCSSEIALFHQSIIYTVETLADIDECMRNLSSCHSLATCVDTEGSYTCPCNPGYIGDGFVSCTSKLTIKSMSSLLHTYTYTDIDECGLSLDDCDSNADCTDTIGSFVCTCVFGYTGTGQQCGMFQLNCAYIIDNQVVVI